MALARFQLIRRLHRSWQPLQTPSISRSYRICSVAANGGISHPSTVTCSYTIKNILDQNAMVSASDHEVSELPVNARSARLMSTSTEKLPRGARQVALKVAMLSPGFVYEPYKPREPISFWQRWFTRSGWKRTKEDAILELKSAYAITRLRKTTGYSKKLFYQHAVRLYKEINTLMAIGDIKSLRKASTEKMYSTLKNELKRRESMWSSVHWELVEPIVSIRTLRARMIAIDKDNLDKAFVQLTIEFIAKQKFEAYDSKGIVVSGDKMKEVLVRDIWVFERSLFHPGAYWRLCARLTP
ncbi:uncharacterized protein A4U43_C07F9030 [Asparagus officinalis]|uniref:Large ribosomal subunit protein mL45 n=1 Tax=Asparagus officinalis TaxID=4686 RepID=A0A5P1EAM5_ASPOF|nr:39S ribosomal protein L45, mitochondrial isoform X2 [Asparagus officinalis]ONK62874.1 uncharacterized protein A4U43_C07F9030 [Asparagus officinalis]